MNQQDNEMNESNTDELKPSSTKLNQMGGHNPPFLNSSNIKLCDLSFYPFRNRDIFFVRAEL